MTSSDRLRADAASPRAGAPAILIVGPNPAMDRTEEIADFRPHKVNRALVSSPRAGGKSIIVARAVRRLGHHVSAYGFLGGATGHYLRAECEALGIRDRHTEITDETRINTILVDDRTRLSTVINEPGPIVSPAEIAALTSTVSDDLREGDFLILTGSLPRGTTDDFYASLIALGRARGARSIVDAEGSVLASAAGAGPWAVKCNLDEFRAIAPGAPQTLAGDGDRTRLVAAMHALVDTGISLVIVTLGAAGLIAVTPTHVFDVDAPPVDTKNATGSGDTFLAGFASALADGADVATALRVGAAAASANAAVLIPDIGPDPQLDTLLARTRAVVQPAAARGERLGAHS
ncbi:1-phosphofructokinase family hexose kinase [Leifsonia sp. LS-T14]|uniref:1-phosphofructokinase family hexose kinase n=1 Tax=unclassified Leifsonia TaxID=2663824 RepID=UPI0035A5C7B9